MTEFCCPMREYFVLAILRNPKVEKEPKNILEFTQMGEAGPVIHIRFCPFCGKPIDGTQPTRVSKLSIG
jgi:hypothetical protein